MVIFFDAAVWTLFFFLSYKQLYYNRTAVKSIVLLFVVLSWGSLSAISMASSWPVIYSFLFGCLCKGWSRGLLFLFAHKVCLFAKRLYCTVISRCTFHGSGLTTLGNSFTENWSILMQLQTGPYLVYKKKRSY